MKRPGFSLLILWLIVAMASVSCVSTKKYKALASQYDTETNRLNSKVDDLSARVNELTAENSNLKKLNSQLVADTIHLAAQLRVVSADYNELESEYDFLKSQLEGNMDETEQVLVDLKKAQDDLLAREDRLKSMQAELDLKSKNLQELQSALRKNDSITQSIRKAVADALLGFEGKGLTVHMKNGKVYVSLEEKLLFASGKWEVSPEGTAALKNLAKVLESNKDVNVLIEGHTDNVPYSGVNQVKDNWDLSVMRATAIVKIILANGKIDPKRLMASGRSEYLPVDSNSSAAGRAKNRRTEIILTPKLDELLQIIEAN
jgi:chemotaxis protein MotB